MKRTCALLALLIALVATALAEETPTLREEYDPSALRGVSWGASPEEAQALEPEGTMEGDALVLVGDMTLYELPVHSLTYRFAEGALRERIFQMEENTKPALSTLFYSISVRYGVPIFASAERVVWQFDRMTITAARDDVLTVEYAYQAE